MQRYIPVLNLMEQGSRMIEWLIPLVIRAPCARDIENFHLGNMVYCVRNIKYIGSIFFGVSRYRLLLIIIKLHDYTSPPSPRIHPYFLASSPLYSTYHFSIRSKILVYGFNSSKKVTFV